MAKTDNNAPQAAPYYRRVSEVLRDPAEWEGIPQVDSDALDGAEIVVHDAMFLRGDFDRPDPDYAIILFGKPDTAPPSAYPREEWPKHFKTTAAGGAVVVRKMKELAGYGPYAENGSQLPILGRFILRQQRQQRAGVQPYQDFV